MPEFAQQDRATEPTQHEIMMIDVLSELRIVREEYRQLRIQMDAIDVAQLEIRAQITTAITAGQDNMASRVGRIDGHINNIARDQNNALESKHCGEEYKSSRNNLMKRMVKHKRWERVSHLRRSETSKGKIQNLKERCTGQSPRFAESSPDVKELLIS